MAVRFSRLCVDEFSGPYLLCFPVNSEYNPGKSDLCRRFDSGDVCPERFMISYRTRETRIPKEAR
jgi:hypothetical protein